MSDTMQGGTSSGTPSLETRVTTLEDGIVTADGRITALEELVTTLETAAAHPPVTGEGDRLAQLEKRFDSLLERIGWQ